MTEGLACRAADTDETGLIGTELQRLQHADINTLKCASFSQFGNLFGNVKN